MERERIRRLNDDAPRSNGRYVLYWMQQSQRSTHNPALAYAIARANELGLPVVVVFGLYAGYPEANERHFAFMLEGLAQVATALEEHGIRLVMRLDQPDAACLALAPRAALVVCDRGYLRQQKQWREAVARAAACEVVQIEGDVVVPVEHVSGKREYAARTLRPKITRCRDAFLNDLPPARPVRTSLRLRLESDVDARDPAAVLARLPIDRSVSQVSRFRGGANEARRRLERFLSCQLGGYAQGRNDPADPQCSNLSPYLHFGQISPVEIACRIRDAANGVEDDRTAFLEELIVRRELAINFVHFEPEYDRYRALPAWARETLARHGNDAREHVYSRQALEQAQTHDRYWNAAMVEMLRTGYMHNYMRMYWGKKIIEWSQTPEIAFETMLWLNNRYFLDGRDPNSYAGVAWVFGLHDRPWTERRIFGTVRYMNAAGLKRKFDIEAYVRWSEALAS